ncbi:hypothetical protein B0H14DRAFT_2670204 [Mycena olivaceomarginata]|nr:hypothetical protein B0H14DRAFT_2670204 [Mycena olivaceomarginata]
MQFSMLSSPSTRLESLLLCSPRSPCFPVARLSYPTDTSPYLPSARSPQLESDIGLQSPSSFSSLSSARLTCSDLTSLSQHLDISSTPKLRAGPRVSEGEAGKSDKKQTGDSRRRIAARTAGPSQWRCASISQVLASSPLPYVEGTEIRAVDIFSQGFGAGLGLGLTTPLTLVDTPRSTDEYRLIPITEVAPGSFSRPKPVSDASSSQQLVWSETSGPAFIHAYAGLGHGLPSHMRGARARLSSIPEEVEAKTMAALPIIDDEASQHTRRGLGFPSVLRQAVQRHASPSASGPAPASSPRPLMSRLESTMHELFSARKSAKRPLDPIAEARSREPGGKEKESNGRTASWQREQRKPSPSSRMSPAMLLAAQSILDEERKLRKKQGLDKVAAPMSSAMRFVSQVVEEQEEQRRRENLPRAQSKKFKFLF